MQETQVQSLGQVDLLEKGMATHSSILAWRTPWTEEPSGLQSQRVRYDWATNTFTWWHSVQSLSHVRLFVTPWTAARQASLSITNSWSLLKLMSIELVMPSNHHPLSFPSPPAFNLSQHQGLFQCYHCIPKEKVPFYCMKIIFSWNLTFFLLFLSLIASPVIQLAKLKTSESHLTSSPNLCHSATRGILVSSLHIHHSVCSDTHCFSFLMTSS